jgi:excinuclease ABC subunit A
VAEGTPETVAKVPESHTGRFLADVLDLPPVKSAKAKPAPKAVVRGGVAKSGGAKSGAVKRAAPKVPARKPVKARANAK